MSRTAIISVDGHVKAPRAGYREYVEQQYLEDFDRWLQAAEEAGLPDAGNLNPAFGVEAQWDSDRRLQALERVGVVAEVLFPNGQPFQMNRLEDFGRMQSPELAAAGRQAYNRWLADFCGEVPGRRAGQAVISFDDIDQAVKDVSWAKEHGLGGIMMPPLNPGGTFFFDPVLDPVWAAISDVGLPISQHGGSGAPAYSPPGFASIITLAMEHSFFSGRSLSQLMVGGVFDRFPDLQVAFVETEAYWMGPMIKRLEQFVGMGSDWMGFARAMNRDTTMSKSPREYWAANCHAGLSPFNSSMVPIEDLALGDDGPESEFFTGAGVLRQRRQSHVRCRLPALRVDPAVDDVHPGRVARASCDHRRGRSQDPLRQRGRALRLRSLPCSSRMSNVSASNQAQCSPRPRRNHSGNERRPGGRADALTPVRHGHAPGEGARAPRAPRGATAQRRCGVRRRARRAHVRL